LSVEIIIVTSHRVGESLGGVERFVMFFSSWCSRRGFGVTVVSRSLSMFSLKVTHGEVKIGETKKALLVKTFKLPYIIYCLSMAGFSLLAFLSLLGLIKNARLTSDKPVVVHSQDMNFAALATVLAGKLLGVPTVLHQHGPYFDMLSGNSKRIELALNMFNCRMCDKIIVTDRSTESYVARVSGRAERITVIPAAIDTSIFKDSAKKECSIFYTVGYIGRLSPEKNLTTLLFSFKELLSCVGYYCRLILIGDGESRIELAHLALDLKIKDSVIFAGFQTNIAPFLSAIDVFVLPSKVEGTPISLMEAMASGKAIIASNLPSIQEIVIEGENALLFNSTNVQELTNALIKCYNEPELREKIGTNARKAAAIYDVNSIFEKMIQIYFKCM
jgi:glycosyltransferase involved in cell wall biosynthesis